MRPNLVQYNHKEQAIRGERKGKDMVIEFRNRDKCIKIFGVESIKTVLVNDDEIRFLIREFDGSYEILPKTDEMCVRML